MPVAAKKPATGFHSCVKADLRLGLASTASRMLTLSAKRAAPPSKVGRPEGVGMSESVTCSMCATAGRPVGVICFSTLILAYSKG